MEKEKKGTRTRKKLLSKQRFLKAVSTILKKEGYQKLGVNRVAEVAGIDKSSLYYHFGSFENLLEQYILANDYWLNAFKEPLGDDDNLIEKGKKMVMQQFDAVLKNEELQAILLWELSEKKGIPKYIAGLREEMAVDTLQKFEKYFADTGVDFEMISAMITSSIYYMILHRQQSRFCNIDINDKAHVERMKNMIHKIIDLFVQDAQAKKAENALIGSEKL